jgi:hypothetical protein
MKARHTPRNDSWHPFISPKPDDLRQIPVKKPGLIADRKDEGSGGGGIVAGNSVFRSKDGDDLSDNPTNL